jgi:hypothetical protein
MGVYYDEKENRFHTTEYSVLPIASTSQHRHAPARHNYSVFGVTVLRTGGIYYVCFSALGTVNFDSSAKISNHKWNSNYIVRIRWSDFGLGNAMKNVS